MTTKEAIETFQEFIDHFQTEIRQAEKANDKAFDREMAERDIEAFKMAVKALEAQAEVEEQPEWVKQALDNGEFADVRENRTSEWIPTNEWIPTSERLPDTNQEVFVYFRLYQRANLSTFLTLCCFHPCS